MPTLLENAKDAAYTAIGLNVLLLDDLNEMIASQRKQLDERFSGQRKQLDEQLDIAREHGQKARERIQPVARRTWDAAEPTVSRLSEITPAPLDEYVNEGIGRIREYVNGPAKPAPKPAAKKASSTKSAARKSTARKSTARKSTAKK